MSVNTLRKISKTIQEKTGLLFTEDKFSVFQKKIDNRIKELKLNDYSDYLNYLVLDNKNSEFNKLINILTVNETFFFRHLEHFEALKNIVLPQLRKSNQNKISIWSAACANGCEVYSIAIVVHEMMEYLKTGGIQKVEIIGTDISTEMLDFAKNGIYTQRCVTAEMPQKYLIKYFNKIDDNQYILNDEIKKMVTFRILNLKNYIYPKELDVIFFRNVLYYFDNESQYNIAVKIYDSLKKGGTLFLGGTEVCRYYEFFESTQINETVYYSKWSTDRRKDQKTDYGRIPSWNWQPPVIKYDKNNNEIIFSGLFADNCNIERIKNDIMFYVSLTNFKETKKIKFNFEKIRWITNDMLSEIKNILKYFKTKDLYIIIVVGDNADIFKWLKTSKFDEFVSIKLCSRLPKNTGNSHNYKFKPQLSNKPFEYIKADKISINSNPANQQKICSNKIVIKRCSKEELTELKDKIVESLQKTEDLIIDIAQAESISIELFDIINKGVQAADSKIKIKVIE